MYGPRRKQFLMSEVSLYGSHVEFLICWSAHSPDDGAGASKVISSNAFHAFPETSTNTVVLSPTSSHDQTKSTNLRLETYLASVLKTLSIY